MKKPSRKTRAHSFFVSPCSSLLSSHVLITLFGSPSPNLVVLLNLTKLWGVRLVNLSYTTSLKIVARNFYNQTYLETNPICYMTVRFYSNTVQFINIIPFFLQLFCDSLSSHLSCSSSWSLFSYISSISPPPLRLVNILHRSDFQGTT